MIMQHDYMFKAVRKDVLKDNLAIINITNSKYRNSMRICKLNANLVTNYKSV